MAYKSYPKGPVEALVKEYKTLAEAVKKASILKKKEAEKALDSKGLQIKARLKLDIDGVRANFNLHSTAMENRKTAADQALRTAKEAYEVCQRTPTQTEKDKIAQALNKATILLEEATEDAGAYGKAWFELRAYNPVGNGVDKKYVEEFMGLRAKLMADGKPLTLKQDQIKQNLVQIETITRQFAAAAISNLSEARAHAKDLVTRLEDMLKNIKEVKSFGEGTFRSNVETMATSPTNKSLKKTDMPTVESAYKNMVTIVNMWKAKTKTMKDALEKGRGNFSGTELKDGQIQKSLLEAAMVVTDAENLVKYGAQQLPIAAENLKKTHERFK